jgi:RNA polymerase sigma-70 factor (ECF subfamily)
MDDATVIARCLAGEPKAFEALVTRYQAGALSLAWSVLGRRAEAEDAAQEAFLQAYLNLSRFDHAHSFKNWLFAILINRCLDRLKKERTEKKFRLWSAETAVANPGDGPPERRLESAAIVGPLLARLNPRERLALSLDVVEGYTAAEVAEVLRCAESTARVIVFKAKQKLRKWLEGNSHVQTL